MAEAIKERRHYDTLSKQTRTEWLAKVISLQIVSTTPMKPGSYQKAVRSITNLSMSPEDNPEPPEEKEPENAPGSYEKLMAGLGRRK